ncbi:MAG: hypothetical protein IKQ43_09920 [Treponema sp.]|nr:hypothetical protein [Treponema sp.]MBR7080997.1 hypothetical protein [Treponema sp.]
MSMMIVDAWLRNSVTSWTPLSWDGFGKQSYKDLSELLDSFSKSLNLFGESFKVLRSWQTRIVGNCFVYELEMKSKYQLKHPEYNQASYYAAITIVEVSQ